MGRPPGKRIAVRTTPWPLAAAQDHSYLAPKYKYFIVVILILRYISAFDKSDCWCLSIFVLRRRELNRKSWDPAAWITDCIFFRPATSTRFSTVASEPAVKAFRCGLTPLKDRLLLRQHRMLLPVPRRGWARRSDPPPCRRSARRSAALGPHRCRSSRGRHRRQGRPSRWPLRPARHPRCRPRPHRRAPRVHRSRFLHPHRPCSKSRHRHAKPEWGAANERWCVEARCGPPSNSPLAGTGPGP